jgi:hypothetical protein
VHDWVISKDPFEVSSSHYWYRDLPAAVREAYDAVAGSAQISRMFRHLFSERNYCVDIVSGE